MNFHRHRLIDTQQWIVMEVALHDPTAIDCNLLSHPASQTVEHRSLHLLLRAAGIDDLTADVAGDPHTTHFHHALCAFIGSARAARCAGTNVARSIASPRRLDATTNVTGSTDTIAADHAMGLLCDWREMRCTGTPPYCPPASSFVCLGTTLRAPMCE